MHSFYRIVIPAAAFLAGATLAAAKTPSGILNKLEVQTLVAAETAEADLRLARHFSALADRYADEAARHDAMGAVFAANAHRATATVAGDHCERLAAAASEWWVAARKLALYYQDTAGRTGAVLPDRAAELRAGQGAPDPTREDLHRLARAARTRADHLALQEYYSIVAGHKAAEAASHERAATGYRAAVRNGSFDAAVTWDRLAATARTAARKALEAANRHKQLATIA